MCVCMCMCCYYSARVKRKKKKSRKTTASEDCVKLTTASVSVCCMFLQPHALDMDRLSRGKQSVVVDMKKKEGAEVVRQLCRTADVLLEPYRPGHIVFLSCEMLSVCMDIP